MGPCAPCKETEGAAQRKLGLCMPPAELPMLLHPRDSQLPLGLPACQLGRLGQESQEVQGLQGHPQHQSHHGHPMRRQVSGSEKFPQEARTDVLLAWKGQSDPKLTLTPAAPSLPGGPSAPGLPCMSRQEAISPHCSISIPMQLGPLLGSSQCSPLFRVHLQDQSGQEDPRGQGDHDLQKHQVHPACRAHPEEHRRRHGLLSTVYCGMTTPTKSHQCRSPAGVGHTLTDGPGRPGNPRSPRCPGRPTMPL